MYILANAVRQYLIQGKLMPDRKNNSMKDSDSENIEEPSEPSELFEPVNTEVDDSEKNTSEASDSLRIYLRQIGNIPLLAPEKQVEVSEKIDVEITEYRKKLYLLGFVLTEHSMIIADFDSEDIEDQFLPSALKKNDSKHYKNFLLSVPEWNKEILAHFTKLRKAFDKKSSDCGKLREKSVELLMRYPVVYDHLEEWNLVVMEYVKLANPEIKNPAKATEADIPEDKRSFLEEKFLMTLPEFFVLLKELDAIRKKIETTMQIMLEGNLRLVISIAQRFRNKGLPFSDLIQEGNLGLMRALEKFDFRLGHKFSTYASWWIKQTVTRAIAEQSRVIRIPVHMINTINTMNNAEQRFIQEHGREPSTDELAAMLEIPTSRISAIQKMARQPISLQAPIGDAEGGSVLEDILSDVDSDDPVQKVARDVVKEKLHEVLATLPEREQQIIIMRFGLMGTQPLTLIEVSKHFTLTRERIRQLEIKILKKLRSPCRLKYFDGYFHTK